MNNEQKHPLAHIDREIVQKFFVEGQTDYNLAELARLKIRYRNFPGARDIQQDLETILKQWELSEDELYQKTRKIHASGKIYGTNSDSQEDWR
jgi:hypothetical protein